jgi:KTSC domain
MPDEDRVTHFESDSAMIAEALYDYDTDTCTIMMRSTGKIYVCLLPEYLWERWVLAGSKGQFYHAFIRPFFSLKIKE